jgi:hypothetical protein
MFHTRRRKTMKSNKKLRVVAALMSLFLALVALPGAHAAPDVGDTAGGLIPAGLLTVLNTVGDDTFALADLTTLIPDPPGQNRTQHYGPYPSSSPDSSTCGPPWAEDTYDRHFTVHDNGDGTFTVVQQFKSGSFVTNDGPSPGACDTMDGTPPGTLVAGKIGSMQGYFIISNVGAQTSTSPYCDAATPTNANCTTTKFINTHFTPCYPVTCTVTTFFDHYAAGDQGLVYHEWKNASPDRGGNHGDISSATLP